MLKPYKTTVNGYETTLMLSEEDAKAQGLVADSPKAAPAKKAVAKKQAAKPANKSRTAANKSKS